MQNQKQTFTSVSVFLEMPLPGTLEEFTTPSFGVELLCYICSKAVQNPQPFVVSGEPPSHKVLMQLDSKLPRPFSALG